jgi:DNA-binding response OmpR family regulator
MTRILFAEDEAVLGKLVKEALEREPDFQVDWLRNGHDALKQFKEQTPDICVLDIMMPQMDGFTLINHIRDINQHVPVLFLTARSQTADVVKGFEAGGNDYLKKPFSIQELVVRVKELLRRSSNTTINTDAGEERYKIGKYQFVPATQTLKCDDIIYNLSNKETQLLHALALKKNDVTSRKEVLMQLWGDDNFFNARNMDVYIGKLRKYLSLDSSLSIINIRGYGYKLIEQKE